MNEESGAVDSQIVPNRARMRWKTARGTAQFDRTGNACPISVIRPLTVISTTREVGTVYSRPSHGGCHTTDLPPPLMTRSKKNVITSSGNSPMARQIGASCPGLVIRRS